MTQVRSDDLLVLLALSRHRTFVAAGRELGLDHTTVARRVGSLSSALGGRLIVESSSGWDLTPLGETACEAGRGVADAVAALTDPSDAVAASQLRGLVRISAPEGFVARVVSPAVARLADAHPDLVCEIIAATRPTPHSGPSTDLDIGVTRPASNRVVSRRLCDYDLGLFASGSYLAARGAIEHRADLREHTPVYYVESMLHVSDLDLLHQFFPRRARLLGATSVFAQVELVAAGAGVGLLPVYLARPHPDLVSVLPDEAIATLTYWMVGRPSHMRRPEVAAVADAIADLALTALSARP